MNRWRFGRGWSEIELRAFLHDLRDLPVNFDAPAEQMTRAHGWTVDGADRPLGYEPPGPPLDDGLFARARQAVINYDFSDPRIVVGHFDPCVPLSARNMLLEIKVLGFHFLNGVRIHTVRDEAKEQRTSFGYRYDTLAGHIEQGYEWFLLSKRHETGEVRFRIEAHWRLGEFPSWWSRLGFLLLGGTFRHLWRKQAVSRLRRLAHQPASENVAGPGQLAHRGDSSARRRTGEAPE